jgi:hypothetical protein
MKQKAFSHLTHCRDYLLYLGVLLNQFPVGTQAARFNVVTQREPAGRRVVAVVEGGEVRESDSDLRVNLDAENLKVSGRQYINIPNKVIK